MAEHGNQQPRVRAGEPPVHGLLRRARLPACGAAHARAGQAVHPVRQLHLSLHPNQRLGVRRVRGGGVLQPARHVGAHLRHAEQRLRLETLALLVHERKHCVHDTYGLDPQLLRLARGENRRQQGFRSGGDLACEKVRLPLRSGAVPLGLPQPPVAPAAVHQPSLRPTAPVVPFSYGFPPIPIRLGGGTYAISSAKCASGGRATAFFVNRHHLCAAQRHPPEAEGGICGN